jgi:FkbM family methyltransferase
MHQFTEELTAFVNEARGSIAAEPNIDTYRFGSFPQALKRYDDGYLREGLAFIAANDDAVAQTAAAFADDESRALLKSVMAFRLVGPRHVRLPTNTPRYWQHYEDATAWRTGPSPRAMWPFEVSYYTGEFRGTPISIEGWLGSVVYSFLIEQYFFDRGGVSIAPEPGDYVIDAGGCLGDTALAFAAAVGAEGRVYSFEPMPNLRDVFIGNARRNPSLAERMELFDRAVFDASGNILNFADFGAGSRPQAGGPIQAQTVAIDDFVRDYGVPKVDFIKMDIEGSEREALRGAAQTIHRFKPKLAISAYHRPDDLLVLPALIKEIDPSYALFFEHYTIHAEESVIFAIAR